MARVILLGSYQVLSLSLSHILPTPPRCSIETFLNLKVSLIFSLRVEERGSRAKTDGQILSFQMFDDAPGPAFPDGSMTSLGAPGPRYSLACCCGYQLRGAVPPTFFMGIVSCQLGLHTQLFFKGKRDYKWSDVLGPIFTFNFLSFLIRRFWDPESPIIPGLCFLWGRKLFFLHCRLSAVVQQKIFSDVLFWL